MKKREDGEGEHGGREGAHSINRLGIDRLQIGMSSRAKRFAEVAKARRRGRGGEREEMSEGGMEGGVHVARARPRGPRVRNGSSTEIGGR